MSRDIRVLFQRARTDSTKVTGPPGTTLDHGHGTKEARAMAAEAKTSSNNSESNAMAAKPKHSGVPKLL